MILDFSNIVAYLKDPLILIGFFVFIFFGFARLVVKRGLIPTLSKTLGYNILKHILLYGFVIGVLIIILGFFLKYQSLNGADQIALNSKLWDAAKEGSNETIEQVLAAGAQINSTTSGGMTALMLASLGKEIKLTDPQSGALYFYSSNFEAVKALLDKNADVNLQSHSGETALGYAIMSLCTPNYDVPDSISSDQTTAQLISVMTAGMNNQFQKGAENSIKTIRYLHQAKANFNIARKDGNTPLMLACQCNSSNFYKSLAQFHREPLPESYIAEMIKSLAKIRGGGLEGFIGISTTINRFYRINPKYISELLTLGASPTMKNTLSRKNIISIAKESDNEHLTKLLN